MNNYRMSKFEYAKYILEYPYLKRGEFLEQEDCKIAEAFEKIYKKFIKRSKNRFSYVDDPDEYISILEINTQSFSGFSQRQYWQETLEIFNIRAIQYKPISTKSEQKYIQLKKKIINSILEGKILKQAYSEARLKKNILNFLISKKDIKERMLASLECALILFKLSPNKEKFLDLKVEISSAKETLKNEQKLHPYVKQSSMVNLINKIDKYIQEFEEFGAANN